MLVDVSLLRAYQKTLESAVIVSIGMFMHLNRLSVIELKYSRLPLMTPNAASTLFIFSVLCILTKLRPLWTSQTLRRSQKVLMLIVELALILYATDFLLRQVWLPSLKLLNFVCHFLGQYVIVSNEDFLANNAPRLSKWIRNDGFYMARFLLAVVAFIFMVDTTGLLDFIQCKLRSEGSTPSGFVSRMRRCEKNDYMLDHEPMMDDDLPRPSSAAFSGNFDVNDLPFVPQEDLLNLGHRVGARRRRQPMRKAKRAKLLLNEPDEECTC